MCGIFGWQWRNETVPPRDMRVRLATLLGDRNDNRGGKSWGWAALPTAGRDKTLIDRGLGLIVGEASNMASHSALMGHTRQPTTGAVIKENSHPFEFGHIIGAHNGMVHNDDDLAKKYPERKGFQVDSQHIFAHMAEGRDMKELECYGAIEWIDTRVTDMILLCKLTVSGDLSIVQTKHGIVWSSSEAHLEHAVKYAGFEVAKRYSVTHSEVMAVQGGKLWDMDQKIEVSTYVRSSYACTSGGSYSYTQQWPASTSSNNESWGKRNKRRVKSKGTPDVCKNDECGSPVVDGMCTMMYDEHCTGVEEYFTAEALADAPAPGAETTEATEDDSEVRESPLIFADAYVKSVCASVCDYCKKDGPPDTGNYHVQESGSTKSYLVCKGPDQYTVRTFLDSRALMGEIQDERRDKLTLEKREWGWTTACDGKVWSSQDLFQLIQANECKICRDVKAPGKIFCPRHQNEKDTKKTCADPGCLMSPFTDRRPYCKRHCCEGADCPNPPIGQSIYCQDCRYAKGLDKPAQQLTIASTEAPAPTQPPADGNPN